MGDRRNKIKMFLSKSFRNHHIMDDEDIFALGFVNSLLAVQLVTFLQSEFDITIDDDDLDFENFRTIRDMDGLVERKLGARVGV